MFNRSSLEEQYALGNRSFSNINLEKANLEDMFFSRVEMKQANLNSVNFKNADLSDANLAESSLVSTEFSQAHLSGINLSNANLTGANLAESILNQANFARACLAKARLTSTVLIEADLSEADLSGADLSKANLSRAILKGAIYDPETIFPADFDPRSEGAIDKLGIEDLIAQFNHLCECSNRYLGNTMTAKYFNSSRPNSNWLNLFTIDRSNKIIYQRNTKVLPTSKEIQLFQQWMTSFTQSCSSIIKDFAKIV